MTYYSHAAMLSIAAEDNSSLTVNKWGPCRSTPPNISAALTWPWYLQNDPNKQKHSKSVSAVTWYCPLKLSKPGNVSVTPHSISAALTCLYSPKDQHNKIT